MPPTIAIFRFRPLRLDVSALRSVLPKSHQSSASACDAGERGHQKQFQNKGLLYHHLPPSRGERTLRRKPWQRGRLPCPPQPAHRASSSGPSTKPSTTTSGPISERRIS